MATVRFIVKATIPRKKEAAFNRWYNYKHCPQFLRYPGAVSDYDRWFGKVSERARFAYTQVWP